MKVTVFPAKGTPPDVKATSNGVFAPLPKVVVLFTVKVGVLLFAVIITLLVALDEP